MTGDYCVDCGKVATREIVMSGYLRDAWPKVCEYCAGHRDGMAAGHERWASKEPVAVAWPVRDLDATEVKH